MSKAGGEKLLAFGRLLLLFLLAGNLILRRDFAHRNLGELCNWLGISPPAFLNFATVTELGLLLLLPVAVMIFWQRMRALPESLAHLRPGIAIWLALLFVAYGAGHAAYALVTGGDTYLVVRQSALAAYPLFFVYTYLFFALGDRTVEGAAIFGLFIASVTALLDYLGYLGPPYFAESAYGQATLPIAILGFSVILVSAKTWPPRILALVLLGFIGWRQSLRFQSVVPIGIAGALVMFLLLGALLAIRSQRHTVKRAVLLAVLFVVLFAGYAVRKWQRLDKKEVGAWSATRYPELFDLYHRTEAPSDPANYLRSWRPPHDPVADPEFYRLHAVFVATGDDVSVRNNIWRLLVWRRMFADWQSGRTIAGAGVGKSWFYPQLYFTGFNYGDQREGLDPHNSPLNMLYRYGLIGFVLFATIILIVMLAALKAMSFDEGDPLLEAITVYFFYVLAFSCFVVALESPPYALPYWFTLGLIYARARRLNVLLSDPARKIKTTIN